MEAVLQGDISFVRRCGLAKNDEYSIWTWEGQG